MFAGGGNRSITLPSTVIEEPFRSVVTSASRMAAAGARTSWNSSTLSRRMEERSSEMFKPPAKLIWSPAFGTRLRSTISWACFWLMNTMIVPVPSEKLKPMPPPVRNVRASLSATPSTRICAKFIVGFTSASLTTGMSRYLAMRNRRKRPTVASRTAAQRMATRLMRFSTLAPQ